MGLEHRMIRHLSQSNNDDNDESEVMNNTESSSSSNDDGGPLLEFPYRGSPLCPCLFDFQSNLSTSEIVASPELDTYGMGCSFHDMDATKTCRESSSPPPWCQYAWCYVDTTRCDLLNHPSLFFVESNRYFSYATCNYPDVFIHDYRSLVNSTIRIGLVQNTGGWKGSYITEPQENPLLMNSDNDKNTESLGTITTKMSQDEADLRLEQWNGPSIDFIKEAAKLGQIHLQPLAIPDFLVPRAQEFFQTSSQFDLCIYATSLGFLDLCVAQFTITESRVGVADWLVLNTQDLYLISQTVNGESTFATQFSQNVRTIFQPFETTTWFFTIFLVIPVLGALMVFHELGAPGSSFSRTERVLEQQKQRQNGRTFWQTIRLQGRTIPLYEHVLRSIHIMLQSVLQAEYLAPVTSIGGKLHLVGISFFMLTFLAVYTANLASILTQKRHAAKIANLEDAIKAGLRFCATRKHMQIVTDLNGLDPSFFVVDPPSEGGDGLPGFDCPNCNARTRVFDFIDPDRASAGDPLYCHAAIAPVEDLEVLHNDGRHCDKTITGGVVGHSETGLPVFESRSNNMMPLLLSLKNRGIYDRQLIEWKPQPKCTTEQEYGGETASLSIEQLSGIWILTFGFAFIGLIVTFALAYSRKRRSTVIRRPVGLDQNGRQVDLMEVGDEWVIQKGVVNKESGKIVIEEPLEALSSTTTKSQKRSSTHTTKKDVFSSSSSSSSSSKPTDQEDDSDNCVRQYMGEQSELSVDRNVQEDISSLGVAEETPSKITQPDTTQSPWEMMKQLLEGTDHLPKTQPVLSLNVNCVGGSNDPRKIRNRKRRSNRRKSRDGAPPFLFNFEDLAQSESKESH